MDLGATLPKWVKKLEEHRYRSPWDWDATLKWLDRTYAKWEYPRIRIVNKPGIKAFHLKNRKKKADWDGINVYQLESGEVRFFVVEREKEAKTAPKKSGK
ncbi:MAG: hypothetical protein P1V51_18590 [Deltaproteobacteria bacterium]|nr:hypothetical protein [Deltaproteobacteria bacterium]